MNPRRESETCLRGTVRSVIHTGGRATPPASRWEVHQVSDIAFLCIKNDQHGLSTLMSLVTSMLLSIPTAPPHQPIQSSNKTHKSHCTLPPASLSTLDTSPPLGTLSPSPSSTPQSPPPPLALQNTPHARSHSTPYSSPRRRSTSLPKFARRS